MRWRRVRGGAKEKIAHDVPSRQATVVYGAGYLGQHLIRMMNSDRSSRFRPVAVIDDDVSLRDARISGVRVLGTGADLATVIERAHATAVVVCIARVDASLLRSIHDVGAQLGVSVLVFPSLDEVLRGKSRLQDVREVDIEDLIGRHAIETDLGAVAEYLRGKRILVTGAGGSIGAELCRQIAALQPAELIVLDRDETGLQSTQLLIEGNGLLTSKNIILADIRDLEVIRQIFDERRPQVVFHAAALKHLTMLERFPEEAWKTNVLGTGHVLDAARASGVTIFVNVSTDKAANPVSSLGRSKRLAERLTAWAAAESGMRYLSVRFGNVLGSRGSLVPVFAAMIDAGGPLTVTDPAATRFFMSIPEACHLVLQAGAIGHPGEVLILDMGEPVRILDVAERMIARSGRDIAVVFTGLRKGEKLHEVLVGDGEAVRRPVHPKISHAEVEPLDPASLPGERWFVGGSDA